MRAKLLGLMGALIVLGVGGWRTYGQDKAAPSPSYAGAASCMCHADPIQKTWRESKHAQAFEVLRLVGEDKNEKCLPCHTTGFGRGGYGSPEAKADLVGVQCEECHGPAGGHVSTMDKTKITRTPSAAVCARCHLEMNVHARP